MRSIRLQPALPNPPHGPAIFFLLQTLEENESRNCYTALCSTATESHGSANSSCASLAFVQLLPHPRGAAVGCCFACATLLKFWDGLVKQRPSAGRGLTCC